jgi:hypothetical protein
VVKVQNIEMNSLAPDTMQETLAALERIITLTAQELGENVPLQQAKDYLHSHTDSDLVLYDPAAQKKHGAKIIKAARAYKEYRKIVKYYAARSLIDYCSLLEHETLSEDIIAAIMKLPLYTEWENAGGQIIPAQKVSALREAVNAGSIVSWDEAHAY